MTVPTSPIHLATTLSMGPLVVAVWAHTSNIRYPFIQCQYKSRATSLVHKRVSSTVSGPRYITNITRTIRYRRVHQVYMGHCVMKDVCPRGARALMQRCCGPEHEELSLKTSCSKFQLQAVAVSTEQLQAVRCGSVMTACEAARQACAACT